MAADILRLSGGIVRLGVKQGGEQASIKANM